MTIWHLPAYTVSVPKFSVSGRQAWNDRRAQRSDALTQKLAARLRPFDLGYIMGLVVGEGCFTGAPGGATLAIKLATDSGPLRHLRKLLGGTIYGPYSSGVGVRRPYSIFMLRGIELEATLPLFARHLPPSRKRTQFAAWRKKHFSHRRAK